MRYRNAHAQGEQYWNIDETEGYEFTRPVWKDEWAQPADLKPLGNAQTLTGREQTPFWLLRALFLE